MEQEIIRNWFVKHDISIVSIYILSLILIEQGQEQEEDDVSDTKVMRILTILLKDNKIDDEQKIYYQTHIEQDEILLNQLKNIMFDLRDNPNLLNKNIRHTHKCFPCKIKKYKFKK